MRSSLSASRCLASALLIFLAACTASFATESTLYTFSPYASPSPLIQASDGNFYGTAPTGGTSSAGFVFRLTPGGAESVIHSFNGASDGGAPMASLIEGNDGNLYGTTTTGGLGHGTLFRMTLTGGITVLHNFAVTDGTSAGALIENNAGDFFGAATTGGGASSSGTVFEYSHTAVFSVIHTFTGTGGDGARPNSQLLQASDGLIYGATARGGSLSGGGSLFRFNPAVAGSLTTIASFPPTGQSDPFYNPSFGMTEAADGALYGLTAEGGTGFSGYGTVYKVTPAASPVFTLNVYSLNGGTDGGLPEGGFTLGGDHNLYGTASSYGSGGPPNGTIFKFSPASDTFSSLYAFSSPSGDPLGAPLQSADGNFYGAAAGQIYKLSYTPTVTAPMTVTASSPSIALGSSVTLNWHVVNAYSQTAENCWAHGSWTGSKALSGSAVITPASAGTYTYALTCGGVESALATVTVVPLVHVATPVITPASGTYGAPLEYNITDSTAGAVIHYTTDGTTPTSASPVWAGTPVVIATATTVKAMATHAPDLPSAVASASYVFSSTTATACTINYSSGFGSPAGLVLNHGASITGTQLAMTHGLVDESTSAFTKARIPLKIFLTEFRFQFYKATSKSGDGLTFAVNAKGPTLYGSDGAGLGYKGIPASMALKFDLQNDAGEGTNSVGVFFNGALPTVPSVDLTPSGINLHSGDIMNALVTYDGHYLKLTLTDTVTSAQFSHTFTLPNPSPIGASYAYTGFTSSSDLSVSNARVLLWALQSAGPCE